LIFQTWVTLFKDGVTPRYSGKDQNFSSGVIEVAAGDYHTVGVKFDGTVVAAGAEIELAKWNLIEAVAEI